LVAWIALGCCLIAVLVYGALWSYRRCPPGHLLVVYGAHLGSEPAVVLKEGGRFVLPLVQGHSFLSLEPIPVREGERLLAMVRIGTDAQQMRNAAIHLLDLPREEIESVARRILEEHDLGEDRAAAERELQAVGLELVQGDPR
jgi:uncharacterized membrane protein YqiK